MKTSTIDRRDVVLGVLFAALLFALVPAPARAATKTLSNVDTSGCTEPPLSQPLLSAGDSNWYTLAPGQSANNFTGTGWVLSGGARIISTKLADGTTASVLDLPSGASATSPTMCVTSDYPTGRANVRNVVGNQGVLTYVAYQGTKTWDNPQNTGQFHGDGTSWTLSGKINLHPAQNLSGWQPVRFTFVGGGKTSEFEVYGFWVDPRCRG